MVSIKEFFNRHQADIQKGISHKNNIIKRNIIAYMALNGQCTLAELTKELHISIPTITKLVGELVDEALVTDNGKVETPGGRRPNIFGLTNTAIYFAGVDICRDGIRFVVTDLKNNIITYQQKPDYELKDTPQSLEIICTSIEEFLDSCGIDRGKILGMGVCIAGRVNPNTGRSYKYFTSNPQSLREIIEQRTGVRVMLENDTRARCYAEYFGGNSRKEKNMLYLHLGRGGVAIGIVSEGKLYYGKSGFAGEFGHTPFFDNEVICACGKKGCLETEVSGIAIENKFLHHIKEGVNSKLRHKAEDNHNIHIYDIIDAARSGDMLSIELIEEAGEKIGKSIAFLLNIFNPELFIIGGHLSAADELLMLPIKSAASKYSLALVYNDTLFRLSQMGDSGGCIRCCNAYTQQHYRIITVVESQAMEQNGQILENEIVRLRALEPEDVDMLYRWENDSNIWKASNTVVPFSKYILRQFIESQKYGIYETGQLRLIIESAIDNRTLGAVDLFDLDPYNRRAGVGILIYENKDKRRGFASAALELLIRYCFDILGLNQLYCNIPAYNAQSLALFRSKNFTTVGLKKEWIKTTSDWQDEYMLQLVNPIK